MRQRHRPGGPQPDGVETPPRRGPWSRGEAAGAILEAIPCDRWVSAAEIAAETGISSYRTVGTIREKLLGADVECKPRKPSERGYHLYRRLHRVDASKRTPDGAAHGRGICLTVLEFRERERESLLKSEWTCRSSLILIAATKQQCQLIEMCGCDATPCIDRESAKTPRISGRDDECPLNTFQRIRTTLGKKSG